MLFNTEQYHQPKKQSYRCDWDGVKYDPAWDEPNELPEIPQDKVSAVVEHSTVVEVLEEVEISSERWNPSHFGEIPRKLDSKGNPTIFWDESIEPPEPDDFESLPEYEKAWHKWETENSDSLTCVAELGQASPSRELSPKKSNSADSAKSTSFVKKDCSNDSQACQSTTTLGNSQKSPKSTSSHHHHRASPLPLKESAWVEPISEIVSPQYCESLPESNLNSSVSKTSPDCYRHPNTQETNPEHISNRCSGSFASVGMMRNGWLSEHRSLKLCGEEKGSYLLPRPGALSKSSKSSRPPGTTKSEAKAKKLGLIGKKEVFNPEWLEAQFGLPIGWTSPQECRAATELLERAEQLSEIVSTPGLVRSSGSEYSTSTSSPKKSKSKSSDCWYTPLPIVELVIKVLGKIDLDPCSDDGKHLEARKHYTIVDDGLIREWEGQVFMNPPFSCPGVWMKKLQAEIESGRVKEAIALVPAATETNWLSPFLKTQPVCFWKGRIKFLGEDYKPKNAARQSHVLVYWGENWQRFKEVFEEYGFVSVPSKLLGDKQSNSPSNLDGSPSKIISPSKNSPSNLLGDKEKNSPSNSPSKIQFSPSKKRERGEGNGYIYWRSITKSGKDYPQAYYHWKEGNKKRSKYIPKKLLDIIKEAEATKRPVIEILELLGVETSPSKLLGDEENSPSNNNVNADISKGADKLLGDKWIKNGETYISQGSQGSPSNLDSSPSKIEFSPSKRRKGDGSGNIHWRIITKGGKDYQQAYYHYEIWSGGDRGSKAERLTKSSKYIPKRLLPQVQRLEAEKAPVRDILGVLGVMV